MKRSSERILTTHAGSLGRPANITEVLRAKSFGEPYDEAAFEKMLTPAVAEVVDQQIKVGVEVPSDGEFGKTVWTSYISERLGGVESIAASGAPPGIRSSDRENFSEFYEVYDRELVGVWIPPEVRKKHPGETWASARRTVCRGPLTYTGSQIIERDIANLKAALANVPVEEAFLPLAAPASVEASLANEFYPDDESFMQALADALRVEYRAVVDAGLLLQVDDAFIPYNYDRFVGHGMSMEEYLKHCELRIDAVNEALRGIPEDRVRYHVCWGSWSGPHTSDVEMKDIVHLVLRVNAQAYSFEAANPRHEFEWRVWEDVKLPDDKILIPGVVTHSTNVVEHPETVAQRIQRFASLVGSENVIAGTDCGFAQGWTMPRTHPTVQWAKLQALADGARIATERLLRKSAASL